MPFSSLKSEFELFEFTELVFGNELIHEHKINRYNVKKRKYFKYFSHNVLLFFKGNASL